jgi:methylphosphotriester-DNA--protein-cysteine methyltransferase
VWTRLRRAAEALQSGRTLADAATAAGFADQAHFSRRLREMMGLTPAALLPIVRSQSLRAT